MPTVDNAIVLENEKPGNPESEWGLPNGASSSIQGFTTDISTDVGGTVQFKINTDATNTASISTASAITTATARASSVRSTTLELSSSPLRSSI